MLLKYTVSEASLNHVLIAPMPMILLWQSILQTAQHKREQKHQKECPCFHQRWQPMGPNNKTGVTYWGQITEKLKPVLSSDLVWTYHTGVDPWSHEQRGTSDLLDTSHGWRLGSALTSCADRVSQKTMDMNKDHPNKNNRGQFTQSLW